MGNPEPKSWLKFDGTINWPFVLAAIVFIGGAIGFGNKVVGQIDNLDATLRNSQQEFKDLKGAVDAIRLDMAARSATEKVVADHEIRIRTLELAGTAK